MDDAIPRRRTTAGVAAMGAAAMLVLSFGPSALALSASDEGAPPHDDRVWVAPLPTALETPGTPPRTEDED